MPPRKTRRQKIKKNPRLVEATGWTWLILSLLLALFFGGAVRALLSERQVRQWIERNWEKENPAYQLSFARAIVELSEGWRPHFGLRLVNLELTPKNRCTHAIKVNIGDLFLPGPLSILWGAPLHFGVLAAHSVRVERLPSCLTAEEVPSISAAQKNSVSTPLAKPNATEVFLRQRWPLELNRTAHWIDGVHLGEVQILGLKSPFAELRIDELDLSFAAKGSVAKLKASLGFAQMNEALAGGLMQVEVLAKPASFDVSLYVPVREGRVTVHALADFTKMDYTGEFNLDFVPASSLVEILKQTGVITDPISLKRAWLAGQGHWAGRLFAPFAVELIHADNIKLSGDAGRVEVEGLELKPKNHSLDFKPFSVRLDDFSLRYLLEALGRKGYTGVLNNFGRLSGELQVNSAEDLAFRGELEDLEINFSRQSVRTTQKVTTMRWALDLKGQRVSGLVKDIQLENGLFRGQTSFNLDRAVLNGVFQVRVDELQFHPDVQQLMTGGTISPLALYGQGQLSGGQVQQWSGEIGSKKIEGQDWSVDNLKVRSEFANHMMILQVRANKFNLNETNILKQQFRPLFAKFEKLNADLNLQHVSARIEINNRLSKWNNATATALNGEVLFATTGKFEAGQIEANVSLDGAHTKVSRWGILGPWTQMQVSPVTAGP